MVKAQDVVVDGEIITADDIDQRIRFDLLATHRTLSRQDVIEELRDETLKLHEARRRLVDVSDTAVEQAYANMAARKRLTPAQLTAALAQQGIDARTLERRIRADIAWAQLLRLRMRRSEPRPIVDPPLPERRPSPGPFRCADCPQFSHAGASASGS
jgi:peptidyl-prolyl cis-trans isomerase SurA